MDQSTFTLPCVPDINGQPPINEVYPVYSSGEDEIDSIAEYMNYDDLLIKSNSDNSCGPVAPAKDDVHSIPSLFSGTLSDSDSADADFSGTDTESQVSQGSDTEISSQVSITTATLSAENENDLNGDSLPKSFLQLRGISVGNFNMQCNFRVEAAIRIMLQYKIDILAIQEHTPWNRELLDGEINSIKRHCEMYGFVAVISKLQILIIDKQLQACLRDTQTFEDGRICTSRFEISDNNFVTFVPVYGIPHSGGERLTQNIEENNENTRLQQQYKIRDKLQTIIRKANKTNDIVFILGDLQDTPDNTKKFHYGSCRLPKHPLGIVKTCEDADLSCSVYKFLQDLERPIVSRHGSKGGRFIDGLYTCSRGLDKLTGISIIQDSGIYSDHSLIINKIDLGIEPFQISKAKEERIDFRKIMNIPMHIKPGDTHPSLNDSVFHGVDYQAHAALYDTLQETVHDVKHNFIERITTIGKTLENMEHDIIAHTRVSITPDEQKAGKLITRTTNNATIINTASTDFFALITDICREAHLASNVTILPLSSVQAKKNAIVSEKIIPGICSNALSKNLGEASKRAHSVCQRIQLLTRALTGKHIRNQNSHFKKNNIYRWKANISSNLKRFTKQQDEFIDSLD